MIVVSGRYSPNWWKRNCSSGSGNSDDLSSANTATSHLVVP